MKRQSRVYTANHKDPGEVRSTLFHMFTNVRSIGNKVACGDVIVVKMSTKHIRNAIVNLLERELRQGGWTLEELGDKIEVILNLIPLKKQQRDKDAPKKTRTAYTFFCQKNRPKTMERMKEESEDGSCKSVDVVRALANRWRELKHRCEGGDENALEEMNEYKTQSIEDMGRYLSESATYEKRMLPQPE